MKRLTEQRDAAFEALTNLVESAERDAPSPFAKRAMQARIARALAEVPRRPAFFRPALVGAGVLLVGATAAAGYSLLGSAPSPNPAPIAPPATVVVPPPHPPAPAALPDAPRAEVTPPTAAPPSSAPSSKRAAERLAAGEDPTKVAEAVRALRKQGDAAKAQQLLDQYLRSHPRGALAEDALALSIEAAAARKDPRAADYARRYLARYPNGRFRAVAERALAR